MLVKRTAKVDSKEKEAELKAKQAEEEEEYEEEAPVLPFPFMDLEKKILEERGIIFISGYITKAALEPAMRRLLLYHFDEDFTDDVQIIINSPGGNLDAGWAFIDLMRFIKNPIRTIGMGEISSMATMIFIAGDHRILAPNAIAMIHQFSAAAMGNYSDLVADRKAQDLSQKQFIKHFVEHSKYKTEKEVKQHILLSHDNYLSPLEMIKHGLADEVFKPRKRRGVGVKPKGNKKK